MLISKCPCPADHIGSHEPRTGPLADHIGSHEPRTRRVLFQWRKAPLNNYEHLSHIIGRFFHDDICFWGRGIGRCVAAQLVLHSRRYVAPVSKGVLFCQIYTPMFLAFLSIRVISRGCFHRALLNDGLHHSSIWLALFCKLFTSSFLLSCAAHARLSST